MAYLTEYELSKRNREAEAAYQEQLAPARLPLADPSRTPYPEAMKNALAAFDKVIEEYRS